MLPSQLTLELPPSQLPDFQQFLLHHKKIDSFQKFNNKFFVNLTHQTPQEYSAFLQGIKEIYRIKNLKEIKFCQAKCRDGTDCLNKAKYGEYCWKHEK